MHQAQRQQTMELLKSRGIERALFTHPHSVTWLTGFVAPFQMGQNLFSGGPSLVWYEGGYFTLVVLDAYQAGTAALAQDADVTVLTYQGYTIEQPIASSDHLAVLLAGLISKAAAGKFGLEAQHMTAFLQRAVDSALPPATETTYIDGWLVPLRMVKTEEELQKLRENFALVDLGEQVARQSVRAGQREIDVWTAVHSAIQQKAGCRVPLGNDCVVGYRKNNIGGWPLDYEIRESDSLIVDLSTVLHGYWSDGCATYYAGERTPQQAVLHQIAQDALDYAISLIRPGVMAKTVDENVRQFIQNKGYTPYPHHTGHGVGVSGHEAPRIVPYNEEVFQAGMVIMLEPGIYLPGETSVRLEKGLLIQPDGVEILSTFDIT